MPLFLGLLNRRFDPDFNELELNEVNLSGVDFQFMIPGNGSKQWGGRELTPKAVNLHDDGYEVDPTGFYKKYIALQVWDYSVFCGYGFGRPFGDLKAIWEITRIPEQYGTANNLDELQTFLSRFYQYYYNEQPKGRNVRARINNPNADENNSFYFVRLPKDYKTVMINETPWLFYSIWGVKPGETSWYYVLPLSERHFISLMFKFGTTDDVKGKIEAQQKQAAENIAAYMKVTFLAGRAKI